MSWGGKAGAGVSYENIRSLSDIIAKSITLGPRFTQATVIENLVSIGEILNGLILDGKKGLL